MITCGIILFNRYPSAHGTIGVGENECSIRCNNEYVKIALAIITSGGQSCDFDIQQPLIYVPGLKPKRKLQ